MTQNLVQKVEETQKASLAKDIPPFRPGDTLAVHVRIQEGGKSRIQVFQGICIGTNKSGSIQGSFRVRKIAAGGIGVERVFPFYSPNVAKIDLISKSKSRRAKHYYLRDRVGKRARLAVDYDR